MVTHEEKAHKHEASANNQLSPNWMGIDWLLNNVSSFPGYKINTHSCGNFFKVENKSHLRPYDLWIIMGNILVYFIAVYCLYTYFYLVENTCVRTNIISNILYLS